VVISIGHNHVIEFDGAANYTYLQHMVRIASVNLDLVVIRVSVYVSITEILPSAAGGVADHWFVDLGTARANTKSD